MQEGNVSILLERTGRLTLAVKALRTICRAFGVLLCVGLAALVIDATFALAPWGLISVDLIFLGLILAAAVYTLRQAWRNRGNPRRVARQIEQRLDIRDSLLINSIDLQSAPSGSSSRDLIERSIQNGETRALNLSSFEAVDFRRLGKAAVIAAGIVLGIVVTYFVTPRLFGMVLPRYLNPTGQHPPYTLLDFDVEISPETIYHGQPALISAKLSGPETVSQANIVFVENGEHKRLEMFQNGSGVFMLPIDRADVSWDFYVDTPRGRSKLFKLTVLKVPYFETVHVSYAFPEYTTWPPTDHVLDARGIRALEGTDVTITAKSNLPLDSGQLKLFGEDSENGKPGGEFETVTLVPVKEDVSTVSATFKLKTNGRFELSLIGVNGVRSHEKLEGSIVAAPDRMPQVSILEPERHVIAVENWKIPLVVQAADDVGIDRIVLLRGVNGWGPNPTTLPLDSEQPTIAVSNSQFDLEALGARAGDIITYHASAYDNHPSGAHFTDTETYVIQVISEEEYREFARQKYRMEQIVKEFEELRSEIEKLKSKRQSILDETEQLLKKLDSGEQLTDDERKRLEELQKLLKEFAEHAETLAQKMQDRAEQTELYDLEEPYREMLQTLSKQLRAQAENAKQLEQASQEMQSQPTNSSTRAGFRSAVDKFAKDQQPFDEPTEQLLEETEEDLEKLRLADELIAAGERLRAVILQQRDFADRMAQFRDRKSLSADELRRAQRLAKEQELLEQELQDSRMALQSAAEAAEESLPNMSGDAKKLCQALESLEVDKDQQLAARSARAGDGSTAHKSAEAAATKLETLLSDCCTPKSAMQSGDLDGCLKLPKPNLKQSLQQLAQGRSIPGLGQKGKSGAGYAGSKARTAIYGPHMPSQGDSDSQRRGLGQRGPGGRGFGSGSPYDRLGTETLTPESRGAKRAGGGNMRGVPVGYRDQAEAYFKRLADGK